MTTATNRIAPQEARQHVRAGRARLVCAYDSDEKFNANHLEGAISLGEFRAQEPTVTKDEELNFYCA